jgi:hypothetical protein
MSAFLAAVLFAQEEAPNVAEEGKRIIIGMLLVGLTFVAVILLGQLSRRLGHKRKARRAARRRVY